MAVREGFVRCEVRKGVFAREYEVAVPSTAGPLHRAIVDQDDIMRRAGQSAVRVRLLSCEPDRCLVDLPQETLANGRRVWVPRAALVEE